MMNSSFPYRTPPTLPLHRVIVRPSFFASLVPRSIYDWCIIGIAFSSAYLLISAAYGGVLDFIIASPLRVPFMGATRSIGVVWPLIALWMVALHLESKIRDPASISPQARAIATKLPLLRVAALAFALLLIVQMRSGDPAIREMYLASLVSFGGIQALFLFCLSPTRHLNWFCCAVALVAAALAVWFVVFDVSPLNLSMVSELKGRFMAEANPITVANGLFIGAFACLLLGYEMWNWRVLVGAVWFGAVGIFLALNGVLTGSRGPTISFAVIIACFYALRTRNTFKTLLKVLLALGVIWYGISLVRHRSEIISDRFTPGVLYESRIGNYRAALASSPTLFGRGAGRFSKNLVNDAPGEYTYIHNCTLEAYYEHGLVGLALYLFVLIGCLRVLLARYRQIPCMGTMFLFCLVMFHAVESQFSGNLYSWSIVWSLTAACLLPTFRAKALPATW